MDRACFVFVVHTTTVHCKKAPINIHWTEKIANKGDVLLEFSSVKWVLNEDNTLYCNLLGTLLLLYYFLLVNSYFIHFFVG